MNMKMMQMSTNAAPPQYGQQQMHQQPMVQQQPMQMQTSVQIEAANGGYPIEPPADTNNLMVSLVNL